MISETSLFRDRLAKYCVGDGIDIGYGGDPIVPHAICIDLPKRYSNVGNAPQHLHGDARNLRWFRDEVFDWVYSSHLLEDFENTKDVLAEWIRVLKPGGYLILLQPDQQVYIKYCRATGQVINAAHKISNFSLQYLKEILLELGMEICEEQDVAPFKIGDRRSYNFFIVGRKR